MNLYIRNSNYKYPWSKDTVELCHAHTRGQSGRLYLPRWHEVHNPFNMHTFWNKSLLISGAFNAVESVPTVFAPVKTAPPWKTKVLCVLKKGVKRISRQDFRHQLQLGEVPGHPMEHLPVVISEVGQCVCVCVCVREYPSHTMMQRKEDWNAVRFHIVQN